MSDVKLYFNVTLSVNKSFFWSALARKVPQCCPSLRKYSMKSFIHEIFFEQLLWPQSGQNRQGSCPYEVNPVVEKCLNLGFLRSRPWDNGFTVGSLLRSIRNTSRKGGKLYRKRTAAHTKYIIKPVIARSNGA